MTIEQRVSKYYKDNFNLLDEHQFHFASRLYLWNQDADAKQWLEVLKHEYMGDGTSESFYNILDKLLHSKITYTSKNVQGLRKEFLHNYPTLRHFNLLLFRTHFTLAIYGIDFRKILLDIVPINELNELEHNLLKDEKAMAILSSTAINFLYLYNLFLQENENGMQLEGLLDVVKTQYNLNDKTNLLLYIYFYTHCIIGETKYYQRNIPKEKSSIYVKMIKELESLITTRYLQINLDNKLEFLVCCRICKYQTHLEGKIYSETDASLSDEGDFIVDKYNQNPQTETTFKRSEHRNVLFLMSHKPFSPLQ